MNAAEEYWYIGAFEKYKELPWLHSMWPAPLMPWIVADVSPMGYIVFVSSDQNQQKFKVLNNPSIVAGDIIS